MYEDKMFGVLGNEDSIMEPVVRSSVPDVRKVQVSAYIYFYLGINQFAPTALTIYHIAVTTL